MDYWTVELPVGNNWRRRAVASSRSRLPAATDRPHLLNKERSKPSTLARCGGTGNDVSTIQAREI